MVSAISMVDAVQNAVIVALAIYVRYLWRQMRKLRKLGLLNEPHDPRKAKL